MDDLEGYEGGNAKRNAYIYIYISEYSPPKTGTETIHFGRCFESSGTEKQMAMGQNPVPPVTLKSLLKK